MSNRNRSVNRQLILKWSLCTAAFVGVIAVAGCQKKQVAEYQPAIEKPLHDAPVAAETLFDNPMAEPAVDLGVNTFGEVGGVVTTSGDTTGESGIQQHTYTDEGGDSDVALSPDGRWIVYASTRHSENADIYCQRVDGMSVTQLTNDAAEDAFPTFSPDGSKIAFSSTRGGNWDLCVMDTNGKNVVQLTSGPGQDLHPSFSPDGKKIVYSSQAARGGQWEIWTVNVETGQRSMIGYGLFPSWSPGKDVDKIAFQKARQRGSRWFSLWTLDLVDGQATRLTEVASSSNAALVSPTWSPDGKRIVFATIVDPSKGDGKRRSGQQDIWTINADGTNRHRLTDGHGISASPTWGSDGRVYFVSNRGGNETVWSVQIESPNNLASREIKPVNGGEPKKEATADTR